MTENPRPAQSVARYVSHSEQDTDQLGRWLAQLLSSGDVLALDGELGAGKTRLVRAVVTAMRPHGVCVSSPTFVLLQRYETEPAVFHFDAYRVTDADEFRDLGVEEIFAEGGVCLIEWASRVADALPPEHVQIHVRATGPMEREFLLTGTGTRPREIVREIQEQIDACAC